MNHWKEEHRLPDDHFFSVLVHGPPKSHKTQLAERLRLLWPRCKVSESLSVGLRFEDQAGYDLVIRTHITVHQHPNGLSSHWEMVEVEKSRFFSVEGEITMEHYGPEPGQDWVPKLYDLVPIKGPW